jgi:hypothetical protein
MLFFALTGLTALLSENAPKAMKEHDIKTVSCGDTIQGIVILIFIESYSYLAERSPSMHRCEEEHSAC